MQKRTKRTRKKEKWGRLSKEFSYQGKNPRAPSECPSEPEQVRKKIRHLAHEQTYRGTTNSIKHLSDKKQSLPERTKTSPVKK